MGTPRGLKGRICALMLLILSLFKRLKGLFGLIPAAWPEKTQLSDPFAASTGGYHLSSENVLPPRTARENAESAAMRERDSTGQRNERVTSSAGAPERRNSAQHRLMRPHVTSPDR